MTMKNRKDLVRGCAAIAVALLLALGAGPREASAQDGQSWTSADLDSLVAPIALYPDAMLAQIFVAATYPLEIVQADRWRQSNSRLQGQALEDGLAKQSWDPSVAWLTHFPDLLNRMAQNLDWTQDLGDAFLGQQSEVMAAVQRMRQRADQAGTLQSTPQQTVVKEKQVIQIVPANPQVVYVPYYDPLWVYGPWWWPAYPPYVIYPYRPAVVVASAGAILARAGLTFALELEPLAEDLLTRASEGEVVVFSSENEDRVRAVVQLDRFIGAYLMIGRVVDATALAYAERTRREIGRAHV